MDFGLVPASWGLLTLAAAVFLIVLAVCWIILPFAVIGTKPLLREIRDELRRMNSLLETRLPNLGRHDRGPGA